MSRNVTYKLFPKKWYKELTPKKFERARMKLNTYAQSKELDKGLSEVTLLIVSRLPRMRHPDWTW